MQILVADDDRTLAETLRQGLQENGHQVILPFDGTEAIDTKSLRSTISTC